MKEYKIIMKEDITMSELNNNVEEVEAVEVEDEFENEVAEMSKLDKAKVGFKKHGKTIGLVVAGVTLGILGYALGSRKSSSTDEDYDDSVVDSYIVEETSDESPVE